MLPRKSSFGLIESGQGLNRKPPYETATLQTLDPEA